MNLILAATEVVVYTPVQNFFYNTSEGQTIAGVLMVILLATVAGFLTYAFVEAGLKFKSYARTASTVAGIIGGLLVGFAAYSYLF